MRKYIVIFVLSFLAQAVFANVITGVAAIPAGYYDGVSGKKGADNILNALNVCISKDYNEISYSALESHYLNTDFYADTLWDTYSTCRFDYEDANKQQSAVCDGWNKEHVCCQSWLGSGPMVSDMFNVYPTDARINNLRSAYPYGVVSSFSGFSGDPNKHGLGKLGYSSISISGYTDRVYEPDDNYKGDFARTFFYMVARYRSNTLNSGNGKYMFVSGPTNLTDYSLSFLLQWHRNDPVSEKEIDRNQGVYGEQNNRNPFIDYPDLVEYIWGNKVGQTVDLSSMTPTCEGYSTIVKHGVKWSVDGIILRTDSVRENNKSAELPTPPTSCSGTSETFVGWSSALINGISATAPAALYAKASDIPAVTADVIYYAVFAHAEVTQNGTVETSQKFKFSELCSNQQVPTTLTAGDVTLTFDKGTNSNAPKYFDNGNALRCYGGNTMNVSAENITQIDFTFGSSDGSNAITANKGTFSGSRWTGNANSVTFTIGGSNGNRRFAEVLVTMNGTGEQVVYSNFITNCSATPIETIKVAPVARKILIGGQIYIELNNQIYTITGQKIK